MTVHEDALADMRSAAESTPTQQLPEFVTEWRTRLRDALIAAAADATLVDERVAVWRAQWLAKAGMQQISASMSAQTPTRKGSRHHRTEDNLINLFQAIAAAIAEGHQPFGSDEAEIAASIVPDLPGHAAVRLGADREALADIIDNIDDLDNVRMPYLVFALEALAVRLPDDPAPAPSVP